MSIKFLVQLPLAVEIEDTKRVKTVHETSRGSTYDLRKISLLLLPALDFVIKRLIKFTYTQFTSTPNGMCRWKTERYFRAQGYRKKRNLTQISADYPESN